MSFWDRLKKHNQLQQLLNEIQHLTQPQDIPHRIVLLQQAIQLVETLEGYSQTWAKLQVDLGNTYTESQFDLTQNLENAIEAYQKSLQVYTRQKSPMNWVTTQNNLGSVYRRRIKGDKAQNLEEAIAYHLASLEVMTRRNSPRVWATTQGNLGLAYSDRIQGNRAQNLENAITCYLASLEVYTRQDYPESWATAQNNLGLAYSDRIRGDIAQNLENAIACHLASLEVRTRQDYPESWATAQNNLGLAYSHRIRGDKAQNLENTITCYLASLEVYTRQDFPENWATAQNNLGSAYANRIRGDKAQNLEEAITYYLTSLEIRTHKDFPEEWACIQNNLGLAYSHRIRGNRTQNLEEAIACHLASLEVYTRQDFPTDWALSQNNLGYAYSQRIRGDIAQNLEKAIAAFQASLEVYTREDFPLDWARSQNNLGNIYTKRIRGDIAQNLEEAIACHLASLKIYTRQDFPTDWASTQNYLGSAYSHRIRGDRAQNLEEAIACHLASLEIYTREDFPMDWARSQNSLGNVYAKRIRGDRAQNLENAIACHLASLEIYTREDFPEHWATIMNSLGSAYSKRIRGDRAQNLEEAIIHDLASLEVRTRQDFPYDWATTQNDLGNDYSKRIRGDRAQNLENAIAYHLASLEVRTRQDFPYDWAHTQNDLGGAYSHRIRGDKAQNLEESIACNLASLEVYTRENFPEYWALVQNNLGGVYLERVRGDKAQNLEEAISCYLASLEVYTRQDFPHDWAITQNNLGSAYANRIRGDKAQNLENAIVCHLASLEVHTRQDFPIQWAITQNNLGLAYSHRIRGNRAQNLEEAIACHLASLEVYTRQDFPTDWALSQDNLGYAYSHRIHGDYTQNLENAIVCYQQSLLERTQDANPHDHRLTQHNLAYVEAQLSNWEAVHTAYAAAMNAEEFLLELGVGEHGTDDVLRQQLGVSAGDAFALGKLDRLEEALLAIERGRARSMARARNLNMADPNLITNGDLREQFIIAQQKLIETQRTLNTPIVSSLPENERRSIELERGHAFVQAKQSFDTVVAAIREQNVPGDFLLDTLSSYTFQDALQGRGPKHALVYLIITLWGYMALLARNDQDQVLQYAKLELPKKTNDAMDTLLRQKLSTDDPRNIGGYDFAQANNGFALFSQFNGSTLMEKAQDLHAACLATNQVSMLDLAAQLVVQDPSWHNLITIPLDDLSVSDKAGYSSVQSAFNTLFLRMELESTLQVIGSTIMQPLADWLHGLGITQVTLIPTNALVAIPLLATSMSTPDGETFGDQFTVSVAPSARSLIPTETLSAQRNGFAGVGNPQYTQAPLKWGEAEPQSMKNLFEQAAVTTTVALREYATKQWLLDHVRTVQVFAASCHGHTDFADYLNSCLFLHDGQVTLADAFNNVLDLRGLRLLILSACQTAVMDLNGARDEVRSLAMGMIQAGAQAVLGSFWSVDDLATYLLMVRFVQEWAQSISWEPPAAAFARAQRWLRTVTYRELLAWRQNETLPPVTLPSEQEMVTLGADERGNVAVRAQGVSVPLESVWMMDLLQRYSPQEAQDIIQSRISRQSKEHTIDLDDRPYSDPYYWAAFQVYGW